MGDPSTPQQQYAQAVEQLTHIVTTLDLEPLPWVLSVFHSTLDLLDEDDPARSSVLNNLGSSYQLCHVQTGDLADLHDAVTHYRAAASAARPNDPDHVLYLCNVALALTELAGKTREIDHSTEALDSARRAEEFLDTFRAQNSAPDNNRAEALPATAPAPSEGSYGASHRLMVLIRLGNALQLHARFADEPRHDLESIDVFLEALRSLPYEATVTERAELLVNLGSALIRKVDSPWYAAPSSSTGSANAQETAGARKADLSTTYPESPVHDGSLRDGIEYLRSGIEGLADGGVPDGELRLEAMCSLAQALRLRFQQTAELDDLHTAISEMLGLLNALDSGHRLLGRTVWTLCGAAGDLLDNTGDPSQLRRVVTTLSHSLEELSPQDECRAPALASYGAFMRRAFLHGGGESTLRSAVTAGQDALQVYREVMDEQRQTQGIVTRQLWLGRLNAMNSLITTLTTRFEHTRNLEDLEHANQLAEEVVATAEEGSINRHTAWTQLGRIRTHWFKNSGNTADLEQAVDMFERALAAMPEHAPQRALVANYQGRALQRLYHTTGRKRLYRWARKVLLEAADQVSAPAEHRLRAAVSCGKLCAHAQRWLEAREAYAAAVKLLPLIVRGKRMVATPATQQQWATLTADAAACALEAGEAQEAVELIEMGRTALLADFLPDSSDIGQLHRDHPELAAESVRLRRLLNKPPHEPVLHSGDRSAMESQKRAQLAQAWEDLLAEIQSEPDHERHMRPISVEQLNKASAGGAVAVVNLSQYRSDALVIFGGRILLVPLVATVDDAADQADNALSAVDQSDSARLSFTLDWTWEKIVRPVLDRMGYLESADSAQQPSTRPRLWWNAIGPAAFLPLHAATARGGTCALDRVTTSYTPTLDSLAKANEVPITLEWERARPSARALVAAGSVHRVTRGLPPENQLLARYWPSATVLSDENSPGEILQALPRHRWIHVLEPSTQYPSQLAGGLLLDREPPNPSLYLYELGALSLDDGEFAYLGQCGTGTDSPSAAGLPLAGPLHYAGYKHVISTLWEVESWAAIQVQREVYQSLTQDDSDNPEAAFTPSDSAEALARVLRRIRSTKPNEPALWAGHIHIGP